MVVSQRDSIEFVVNENAFVCLKEKQKHVEILFNVTVTATDSSQGELKWVKVNGDEKLRMKAKEYITSLGKPEIEQFYPVENLSYRQVNEWSLADFLFDLEKESSANITIIDDSTVRIAGSEMSVAFAKSYLEDVIVSPLSCHDESTTELPVKRARLESASTLGEEDSAVGEEDFAEPFDAEVEGLLGSLEQGQEKFPSKSVPTLVDGSHCENMKEDIDGAALTALPETSEDFAAKLGYSRELYALAVKKVGRGADRNELLSELVKLKNSAKELNDERYNDREKKDPRRRINSCCSLVSAKQLRPIIIDGSNVAMSHGKQKIFSCKGIALAVEWFKRRGHSTIYVLIPRWRKELPSEQYPMSDQEILDNLQEAGHLFYTPSRTTDKGKRIVCYDDRYIIKVAQEKDGVIVSNDNFRDLQRENPDWKKVVEERLLMYSFVDDMFMPPDDPNGRHGPTIDELLTVGYGSKTKLCQYGRKCTYGIRCKYLHPERDEPVLRDTPSNSPRPYSEPMPISCEDLCEDFKRFLSLPDLHRNQPQPVGLYSMQANGMPPALPSRQLHAAPPPLPPRNNNVIPRGIRTTNENPYAPLPMQMDQSHQTAQMMSCRRHLPPRIPQQHPDYDTLPLFPRNHMLQPTSHGHYNQYNVPNGVYIGHGNRRRGGPYDNIPPPGGQMPVYPARNHAIYQHAYYRSRAPPADDSDEEEKPCLPSKKRHHSDVDPQLEGFLTFSSQEMETMPEQGQSKSSCRDPGMEAVMHPVLIA